MKPLFALLLATTTACGVIRVETGDAKSKPATTKTTKAEEPPRPKTVKQRLLDESMPCGFPILPGIGKTTDRHYLEIAQRELTFYEKWKDGGPGVRVPGDTALLLLRSMMYRVADEPGLGAHADETYQKALDYFAEARPKITDAPTDLIAKDPVSKDFCGVANTSAEIVEAVHGGAWQVLDELVAKIDEERAEYEKKDGHESPRARALVEEARAAQKRFADAAAAWRAAADGLEKDKTRDRLISEKNDAQDKADQLRGLLGLTGFDDGCDKTSVDPVAQARLRKLCPLARREFALIKQIDQIEHRYFDPVYKKYPSPDPDRNKKR